MTTETDKRARMRLGPIVTDLLKTLPDQSSAALDAEVQRLLDRAASTQNVAPISSATQSAMDRVAIVETAVVETGNLVSALTDLTDHRTRELAKLTLHISTLVGTSLTEEGEERDHLHRRFNEMFTVLEKQVEALSKLVQERQKIQGKSLAQLQARKEEERLALPQQKPNPERGMER